jgi:hypothetical protein
MLPTFKFAESAFKHGIDKKDIETALVGVEEKMKRTEKDYAQLADCFEKADFGSGLKPLSDQDVLRDRIIALNQLRQTYEQEARQLKKEQKALEQAYAAVG